MPHQGAPGGERTRLLRPVRIEPNKTQTTSEEPMRSLGERRGAENAAFCAALNGVNRSKGAGPCERAITFKIGHNNNSYDPNYGAKSRPVHLKRHEDALRQTDRGRVAP
ncbi:hypothetical protein EVAR_19038_1 [Eumeta japonica]|uniref:Uncharacterized protein n=1 Tax=Eumeta variegata TaxID=151549 RepID=A0A4C1V8L0_EUMVA|nr:hypothetical protein EVAR_19038_1 [Eumeta japonica]